MKIYQVGGAVRDKLMNRKPHDIDYVVVSSSPEEMINAGFKQVGKNFPVFINPKNKCEYALARKEVKTGNKHTDFHFIFDKSVTLEEDLTRRDFTCNAIAFDEETSQIIDIFNGIDDIKNKTLKHINSEHFIEDPLRILRMCRFAAQLNFNIANETLNLTKKMVKNGLLQYLSPERIWQEILKALQTDNFELFIKAAMDCGALQIILPELAPLFLKSQTTKTNKETNFGTNTMRALKQAKKTTPLVKFAILTLNIGKIRKIGKFKDQKLKEIDIIIQICNRLRIPNNYKKFAIICNQHHEYFSKIKTLDTKTLVDFVDKFTKCNTNDFIEVCRANYLEQSTTSTNDEFNQKAIFFKTLVETLGNIKASNLPEFDNITKDKHLAYKLKEFKIQTIDNFIKKQIQS